MPDGPHPALAQSFIASGTFSKLSFSTSAAAAAAAGV
jgi:hypothetical protein